MKNYLLDIKQHSINQSLVLSFETHPNLGKHISVKLFIYLILSTGFSFVENLVMGKRRAASRYEQLNVSTDESKPGPSSVKKSKPPFSPTPAKRKKSGPSTSTPRVTKKRKVAEGRLYLCSILLVKFR